ncbi:lipid A biosynthesis lauroyl acyltransferase [Halioxenophilus sp. WMMB6]|uniref:LpxL/LpxP family acyltransferase n=1 Tax=Halioxenophilus sp. WMMB6 TaxID=3073815 RepID=UPI00295ED04D|nr:lipid A biosynthesis lauroyl acyltransferase [Halioxenophilus sp. WMMB6]
MHPRYLATLLLMGGWWFFSQLPYSLLVQIAHLLAWGGPYFAKRRVFIIQRNLELCFPELSAGERQQLLKKNLFHTFLGGLEMGVVFFWPRKRLLKMGELHGLENLTCHQSGVLMLSLHNTTIDSAGAVVNPRVVQSDMMYRPHKNPVYEYFQLRGRERHNPHSRCIDRADVRGAIKAMRQGRWLWYAPDQDYGIRQGIFARFFGIEAASVTATARFARAAKVPVVPMVHYRDDNLRWQVEYGPALENFPTGDDQVDVQRINDWVESVVRLRPEQYLWVHRRFKTRPPGAPPLYGRYSKGLGRPQPSASEGASETVDSADKP